MQNICITMQMNFCLHSLSYPESNGGGKKWKLNKFIVEKGLAYVCKSRPQLFLLTDVLRFIDTLLLSLQRLFLDSRDLFNSKIIYNEIHNEFLD